MLHKCSLATLHQISWGTGGLHPIAVREKYAVGNRANNQYSQGKNQTLQPPYLYLFWRCKEYRKNWSASAVHFFRQYQVGLLIFMSFLFTESGKLFINIRSSGLCGCQGSCLHNFPFLGFYFRFFLGRGLGISWMIHVPNKPRCFSQDAAY